MHSAGQCSWEGAGAASVERENSSSFSLQLQRPASLSTLTHAHTSFPSSLSLLSSSNPSRHSHIMMALRCSPLATATTSSPASVSGRAQFRRRPPAVLSRAIASQRIMPGALSISGLTRAASVLAIASALICMFIVPCRGFTYDTGQCNACAADTTARQPRAPGPAMMCLPGCLVYVAGDTLSCLHSSVTDKAVHALPKPTLAACQSSSVTRDPLPSPCLS